MREKAVYWKKQWILLLLIWAVVSTKSVHAETKDDFYIIPDVDSRYLTDADIADMSPQILNYAKNEIYARHGRMFVSPELQNYFGTQKWYQGKVSPDSFQETRYFNSYENTNSKLISAREKSLAGAGGYPLDKNYSFQPVYDYLKAHGRNLEEEQIPAPTPVPEQLKTENPTITSVQVPFDDYVKKYHILSRDPYSHYDYMAGMFYWCEVSGVFGAFTDDFNEDGTDECILVYVSKEQGAQDGQPAFHMLHLAVLTDKNGSIEVTYDMELCRVDDGIKKDIRIMRKQMEDRKYLAVQSVGMFNGLINNVYILHVGEEGQLYLDDYISCGNEGAATYLTEYPIGGTYTLVSEELQEQKIELFFDESGLQGLSSSEFGNRFQQALAAYRIRINWKDSSFGYENWLLDQDETMTELCSITEDYETAQDGKTEYKYTFGNLHPDGIIG